MQEKNELFLVSNPKGKQRVIANLDQPMQGKCILTAGGFTDGNGFGSRYADDFGTYPKNGVSYYIVNLNHTYNIAQEARKVNNFFHFFLCRKRLIYNDLQRAGAPEVPDSQRLTKALFICRANL